MKAALYIRVSTDRQTVENQGAELLQLAAARGYEPVIYEEVESAAKSRPVLDRMLADARAAADLVKAGDSVASNASPERQAGPHGTT